MEFNRKQEPIFLNIWKNKFDVIADFEGVYMTYEEYTAKEVIEKYEDINILFASYGCDNYSGDAWVLFEQDDKLYEVNGSHCSCYGLEGQWQPELVSLKELKHRLLNGTFGEDDWSGNNFKKELCEFLDVEYVKNDDF